MLNGFTGLRQPSITIPLLRLRNLLSSDYTALTEKNGNGYLCDSKRKQQRYWRMFKRLKEFYEEYKPYIRVDIIMYAVLILLIILYFVISTFL
jgi:hypothetical protein